MGASFLRQANCGEEGGGRGRGRMRWQSGGQLAAQCRRRLLLLSTRSKLVRTAHGSSFDLGDETPAHFRCTIHYDGSDFHGFQSQRSAGREGAVRTVQVGASAA